MSNIQCIEKYVSDYLVNCSIIFLQDIIDHGIYNLPLEVWQGDNIEQREAIAKEFKYQALFLISGSNLE